MKKLILLIILIVVSTNIIAQKKYEPFTKSYSYLQRFKKDYNIIGEHKILTKVTFNYDHMSYIKVKVYDVDDKPQVYTYYITNNWTNKISDNGIEIKSTTVINTHDNVDTEYSFTIFGDFEAIMIYNRYNETGASFTNTPVEIDEPIDSDVY
jgi:hypothetical protein